MPSSTRRFAGGIAAVAASVLVLAGCTAGPTDADATDAGSTQTALPTPDDGGATTTDAAVQAMLDDAAAEHFDDHALGSLLVEIRIDGEVAAQVALGDAMSGVPVTLDGRFRNGAVAITYMSTVMLVLAEEGVIDLDEPIDEYLPDLPESDQVTPRMLADMTAGYPDHVANPAFVDTLVKDPFLPWTTEELQTFRI